MGNSAHIQNCEDESNDHTNCIVYDEKVAGKGSNIFSHSNKNLAQFHINGSVEELDIIFENCSGQYKKYCVEIDPIFCRNGTLKCKTNFSCWTHHKI